MLTKPNIIQALKICTFLVFIGRAYQYLFFDAPFRAFLWDESLLQTTIESFFNVSWNEYVTNLTVDKWIQKVIRWNGAFFVIAAISSILITKKSRSIYKLPLYIGGVLLILLSVLSTKEKFYHYGQFFEHSIQFGVPFILLIAVKKEINIQSIYFSLKVLIALTFVSHGLYALGYYPIPGYFIDMTINILGVDEKTAKLILYVAGVLDILVSILIFIPRVAYYALLYAFFWGTVTALARIVAGFSFDFIFSSMHQSLYKVIFRLPHGLLPLSIFIAMYTKPFRQLNKQHKVLTN